MEQYKQEFIEFIVYDSSKHLENLVNTGFYCIL